MVDNLEKIFKAYDVRGKVGEELTPDLLENIGRAFADWLPSAGPVAVGRDMRPDSEALAEALVKGLSSQGREVWDIGQVTSEMVYFATGKYGLAGGAVVTASHNPGKDNGIKFCAKQARAISIDTGLAKIRDLVKAGSFQKAIKTGAVINKNLDEEWVDHVLGFVNSAALKPIAIAVDAGNGMAGKIFPLLEKHTPFKVTEMFFELDGSFPNHEANPMKFETLKDIIAVIKDNKLDAGIAFDADGDRAFLIDEQGQVLTGGVMSSILADHFLRKNPGSKIVYDVRNSRSVPELINQSGGTAVEVKAGHSFIKDKMREVDAPFGAEASGHYYFRDNWYADSGLIAALIALEELCNNGSPLSAFRKKYIKYAAISETNYIVEDKQAVMDCLSKDFSDEKQEKIDGISVFMNNGGWFNVRPSNTEPLLRFNAEAPDQQILDRLVTRVEPYFKNT
jgi:phosphomannomutase